MINFDNDKFEECTNVSNEEQIFTSNPIWVFQKECLQNVLALCGWNKRDFAHLLNVSISTANNILANKSMTNSNPTYLSRCQFISLLYMIQIKKVNKEHKFLVVLYLFSWLCSGLSGEMDFNKYNQLLSLEISALDKKLFYKVVNNLCPDLFHLFNKFMEWRKNGSSISMSEYYGGNPNEDIFAPWFKNLQKDDEEQAIEKLLNNIDDFIPKYLEWFIEIVA
jgi:hypothetical protein